MRHNFYGQKIDGYLSALNDTPQWDSSIMGQLYTKSERNIFIREIPLYRSNYDYAWRITNVTLSQEDGLMSSFMAFDLDGNAVPNAVFGIHWDEMAHRITGGFKFRPEFGNQYYVPNVPVFPTVNLGGYTVQVLDTDYPSEGLSFGYVAADKAHRGILATFRLFAM